MKALTSTAIVAIVAGTIGFATLSPAFAQQAQQPGGASEQAVYEPDRGRGPGQRFQQRDHPVRGHELHHHEVHRERGQVRPVANRAGPSRYWSRWMTSTACW